ncbi:hypothetical protein VOLCADRAFT_69765 [Volvox carteri f. nagariensis]|uniref:Peptidase M11 gametolysin domain-containing protein n=1 Tax=Volvox carteri f. nagariensis TaxID=3068 RepID=D8UJ41_VOLCA|nr:uncharacterized protein VOLCADRAFT_69765 [Volvox carteri f. nagariensis]EFJ40266.1 hypothetical protein VOLCADRAFT_69765 [Volvox carteri f. nagariensis]|eukprot:XP_002958663.1 hypothetical protein VOLCADRAFT_69765 [Volvox carteri f. nagariensis]
MYNATAGECAPDSSSILTVLSTAPAVDTTFSPVISQRLLVMIVDYPDCGLPANLTENDARTIYLGPNQDGKGGIAEKYTQCSYGRFGLNVTAFRAVRVPHMCSTSITSQCAYYAIQSLADTATKALIGAAAFSTFTHYTYLLPPGLAPACTWSGLALLPGRTTWLQTAQPRGVNRWATVMQEAIHNYGLWHSWQNGTEYGDYSTAMGRGNACPNSAEISRMGWATPAVGGDQLNSSALPPGTTKSFVLPATYLTGSNNYLRVIPDWLPTYTNFSLGRNLYIAVRVAKSGDASLISTYASKVNIHEVNAVLDNGYPALYSSADRIISFINAVGPLDQRVLDAYKLVVYGGPWIATDYLRVHLCRYVTSPSECPPLNALEAVPPPPSPPPSPGPSPPRPPGFVSSPPPSPPPPSPRPPPPVPLSPSPPPQRPPPPSPSPLRPPPPRPSSPPPPSPPPPRPSSKFPRQ